MKSPPAKAVARNAVAFTSSDRIRSSGRRLGSPAVHLDEISSCQKELHASPQGLGCKPKIDLMIVPTTRQPLDKERPSMRHIYKMLVDGDECANHKAAISQRAAVLKLCRATALEVHRTLICGQACWIPTAAMSIALYRLNRNLIGRVHAIDPARLLFR